MVEPTATPADTESPAARLIDDLLAGGEAVDEGSFTLDAAAAAAKLEQFAYADRSRYLVAILEGLLGLGAREVALETQREDLVIRGRGLRLDDPERCFIDLYSHAIGLGSDPLSRALGRVAIGLDMVLGGEATERARLCYSGPNEALIGVYRRRAAPELEHSSPEVIGELSILIDHPWIRRTGADGRGESLEALREAVRFCEHEISLDGQLISQRARDWFETLRGEGPGYRFTAGLEQAGDARAVIELWTAGVCIERIRCEGRLFTAVIELEAPRRDLSQTKVVRDETVEQAFAAVEQAHVDALQRLEQADADWTGATRPSAWPVDRVDWLLDRAGQRSSAKSGRYVARMPQAKVELREKLKFKDRRAAKRTGPAVLLVIVGFVFGLLGLFALGTANRFAAVCLSIGALNWMGSYALMRPFFDGANRAVHARDQGVCTKATITGFEPREGQAKYGWMLWSFEDQKGVERTGRSLLRRSKEAKHWSPREAITIYYDPANPEESWWEADVGPRLR